MLNVEGFGFEPPPGFRTEEMTVGLRMGLPGSGPQPTFIVQSRPARARAKLEELAAETMSELAQSVPHMQNLSRSEISFTDGGAGVVLAYDFATQTSDLRQYFVLRLHGERLCTVTLTIPRSALTEGNAKSFMQAIASLKPV